MVETRREKSNDHHQKYREIQRRYLYRILQSGANCSRRNRNRDRGRKEGLLMQSVASIGSLSEAENLSA